MVKKSVRPNERYQKSQAEKPELEASVLVPLIQSLVTAILSGLVAASFAYCFDGSVLKSFCIVSSVTAILVWLMLLKESREILWLVETLVGKDFDKDDSVGRPPDVNVEVINQQEGRTKSIKYSKLPVEITEEDLTVIASIVIDKGRDFSRNNLSHLSPKKYSALIKYLMKSGMMVFKNGKNKANGVELTAVGRSLFKKYSKGDV